MNTTEANDNSLEYAKAWGRVFGVMDDAMPDGLPYGTVTQAYLAPLTTFGGVHKQALQHLTPEHERMMEDALQHIEAVEKKLSNEEQGSFVIGFYHAKHALTKFREGKSGGAPIAENRVDWSQADWAKSNAELGRENNTTSENARQARKRYAPETIPAK